MRWLCRNIILILCVWLMLIGVCLGKQVYLRDGGIIDCESFWQRGDKVIVKVNRDVIVDLERNEVDVRRTFHKSLKKRHVAHRMHPATSAQPGLAATPAATAAPVSAGPPQTEAKASSLLAPAAPAAKTDPPPIPAPAPVVKETAMPEPAQPAAADAYSPPDKAELERKSREAAEMMAEAIQKHDPELLKKAVEAQRSLLEAHNNARSQTTSQPAAGLGLRFLLLLLAVCLLIVVSLWVTFEKAGESGVKSIVPVYNMYVLMKISGKQGWWVFLLFIPLVGTVFHILAMLSLAERFGRGALFGIGLVFLPMFFFPLLAFGGSQYDAQEPAFQFN